MDARGARSGRERPRNSYMIDVAGQEIDRACGRLAQLVARFVHTEEVIGSSPVSPTQEKPPGEIRGASRVPAASALQ